MTEQAFPCAWTEENEHGVKFHEVRYGLTKREYFAARATDEDIRIFQAREGRPVNRIEARVRFADALIAALKETGHE